MKASSRELFTVEQGRVAITADMSAMLILVEFSKHSVEGLYRAARLMRVNTEWNSFIPRDNSDQIPLY